MATPLDTARSGAALAAALEPERRLDELARSAAPLRRVVVALAGRLVERRAWARLGYARLGDYARERLGLSARSLQEFARVDRALAELPGLEKALVDARLPWSKVRMLARFATREDEAHWVRVAGAASVRELERRCRAVDRGALEARGLAGEAGARVGGGSVDEDGQDVEPSECVRIGAPIPLAFKWRRTVGAAAKVAGEPTTAAGALEWLTAETLSALSSELDEDSEGESDRSGCVDDPTEVAPSADAALEQFPGAAEPGAIAGAGIAAEAAATDAVGSLATPVAPGSAAQHDTAALAPQRSIQKPGTAATPHPAVPACEPRAGLPRFLQSIVDGIEHAGAHELDARLRRAIRLEQRLDAEVGPLLRRVTESDYEWRERFHSLGSYAREHLGMSPRKARALLRLERVGDVCPELRAAYRDGALSWVQAQTLAPLLVRDDEGDWRRAWVDWASRVAVRRLQAVVDRALELCETDAGTWEALQGEPDRIDGLLFPTAAAGSSADVDEERQTCARPRESVGEVRIRVRAPRSVARLFRAALCSVRRAEERAWGRLPPEAEAFEAMIDHALESWQVDDRWLRRTLRKRYAVFERDGWRCSVPGCSSRRNLHAHHVRFRSAGGPDTLENQTTLCAHHHLRGVHGGTVRIAGSAPDGLWFELGTRADGPPIARYRSGDRVA